MKNKHKRLKVALIFGGKSVEHEVSLMSAKNVAEAMDKNKYEIIFIGIDKSGRWLKCNSDFKINKNLKEVSLVGKNKNKTANQGDSHSEIIDVAFPILHGSYGEDGTIQGLLKMANIPFVGPSILGSSVGFDKDVTKRLLNEAKIPNIKFITFKKEDAVIFSKIKKVLNLPIIIKPANSGSSVGISKASNEKEFNEAVKYAFKFDNKIIIEKFLENKREIECAILGNENPRASVCGEVITNRKHKFYSYEAKYFDSEGALCEIPAKISKTIQTKVQNLAIKTFKVLELENMSRIDFFMDKNGKLFVNEVNTIPGFTNISMYPTLWKHSGISYEELIDKLIELAIDKHKKEDKLQTSYSKK